MKDKKGAAVSVIRDRIGENVFVPATAVSAGSSTYNVRLADAPVPEKRYTSDAVSVVSDKHSVSMMFGQRKIGSDELRSLVIVAMSSDWARQWLRTFEVLRGAANDLRSLGMLPEPLRPVASEPEQTVALIASMAYVGMSGEDTCIDYYYTSPFALQRVPHTARLAVDPVVRVNISTPLFLALWDDLERVVKTLPLPLPLVEGVNP